MVDYERERLRLLIAVLIALLFLISLFAVTFWAKWFGVMEYQPDTETNFVQYQSGLLSFGCGGGQTDNTGNEYELLDSTEYVTAYAPDKWSEKLVLVAKIIGMQPTIPLYMSIQWRIYIDDNPHKDEDGNWVNPDIYSTPDHNDDRIYWVNHGGVNPGVIRIDPAPGAIEQTFVEIVQLKGPLSGNYIRVEFWWHIAGWTGIDYIDHYLKIHDEAILLDGSGSVTIQPSSNGDDVFYEGETMTIVVSTGASGPSSHKPDKGWQLRLYTPSGYMYNGTIYDDSGNAYTLPVNLPDFLDGAKFYWTVPQGAFNPSGNNRWYWRLYNSLIEQAFDSFFTVDVAEKQPTMKSLTATPLYPRPGDIVTVTMEGQPNAITNAEIIKFIVDIYYGTPDSPENYIMQNAEFPATNNKATVTFTASRVGHITVEARCMDAEGRVSAPITLGVDVSGEQPPIQNVGPGQYFVYHLNVDIDKGFIQWHPDYIVAKFIDSRGKLIYEDMHKPDLVQDAGGHYHVEDTISFQVPAFPATGEWNAIIQVVDKVLLLEHPMHTETASFNVVEGGFVQNMLAPKYFHIDLWVWEKWIKIPAFWSIVAGVVILIVMLIWQRERVVGSIKKLRREVRHGA